MAQALFQKVAGPCPALKEQAGGAGVCGLVTSPAEFEPLRARALGADRLSKAATVLVGAGQGCDALLDGEPVNREFRRRMTSAADRTPRRVVDLSLLAWGVERV